MEKKQTCHYTASNWDGRGPSKNKNKILLNANYVVFNTK
jgi:hypothetical protein